MGCVGRWVDEDGVCGSVDGWGWGVWVGGWMRMGCVGQWMDEDGVCG